MAEENHRREIDYPIGIQSFPKLRENGFLYVDKTEFVYRLVRKPGYFFLSRPRRFGKSLLLSTIAAYFEGRRDLFKGLAIDSLTDDWEPHPVLRLDLNSRLYSDRAALVEEFNSHFEKWEGLYGDEKRYRALEERFGYIIEQAYSQTGKKVVILIDEYDKPLLSVLHDRALYDEYTAILKSIYGNLKSKDQYIQMGMLTGVARFGKVSVFSDLNNLRDISYEEEYAAICGITSEELDRYLSPGLESLAQSNGVTVEGMREQLRRHYDGYHFTAKCPDIYNPFSLLQAFAKREIRDYWFETELTIYYINHIRKSNLTLSSISPTSIPYQILSSSELLSDDPITLLYQLGYLTIKGYDPILKEYELAYPNEEVKNDFLWSIGEANRLN